MRYLKTNTATRITIGPFLDKTDGITPETALTVTSEKLTFVVDTAGVPTLILDVAPTASGGANDMVHITGDDSGYYDLELAAANVNYLGPAFLSINDVATHLPVFHEFMILPANIYDSIVLGTDLVDVSATQILGTAISTPATAGILDVNVKNMNNVAGTSITAINANQGTTQPINFTGTGATAYSKVDVTDIATAAVNTGTAQLGVNVVTQANIDFGALQKTSLNAATPASVQNIPATGTGLTAIPWNASWDAEVQSECTDALNAYDPPTKAELDTAQGAVTVAAIGANVITAASMNADAGTEIAAAVWAKTGAVTSLATELLLERLYEMINNKMIVTEATGAVALRNLADSADVATGNVQDLGATTVRAVLTWV